MCCSECDSLYDEDELDGNGVCCDCRNRDEWDHEGFYEPDNTFNETKSARKFGVEIETSVCPNHRELRGQTIWGCKEDGSVDGMEFVSPVLSGDKGLETIDKLCKLARERSFETDSSCGIHVHCDLSSESEETCFKVALGFHYTYDIWTRFVSNSRSRNYYCAKHEYEQEDCQGDLRFSQFIAECTYNERYRWINWYSHRQHGTVENRLHGGSLNPTKIKNWVKANLRFVDGLIDLPVAEITRRFAGRDLESCFNEMARLWDDSELTEFYRQRAEHFNKPIVADEMSVV